MHESLTRSFLTLAAFAVLAGCAAGEDEIGSKVDAIQGGQLPAPVTDVSFAEARATKVVMDPVLEQNLVETGALEAGNIAHAEPALVYMNRQGGTFTPGQNDARSNRSSLAPETVNFGPANISDNDWTTIMGCVRDQFSRFNIEITDVDPGNVPHYESVVAGRPSTLGFPSGVGGVSPFTSQCDVIPNSIVFTFADVYQGQPQRICEVAAQEIAHSFGLDHEYLCSDPMSYLSGCGAKSFQDTAAPCGENSARSCAQPGQYDCGYAQQNSVQLLAQRLGLKDENGGGLIAITAPSDGAAVGSDFTVRVDADGTEQVNFYLDGEEVSSSGLKPYVFNAPKGLSLGTHVIEVVAQFDGTTDSDSISINLVGEGDGTGGGDPIVPEGPQVVGGCASSSGSGSGSALAGLWLLAMGWAFRRRRVLAQSALI